MPSAQGQIRVTRRRSGNGIIDISSFFALSASRAGVTIANTSGWTTTLLEPTMEKPYLWRYMRTTYTAQSDTFTTPEMVATYLSGVHPNLLLQTDFRQISLMHKWDKKSLYEVRPGQTATDYATHIIQGREGNNAYYDSTEYNSGSIIDYKEVLRQTIHGPGHLYLTRNAWYTLSFWAKGTSFLTYVYGSATQIDLSVGCYVDGVWGNNVSDCCRTWTHADANAWVKHTFTFKMADVDLVDPMMFLVRLVPPSTGTHVVTICMPKIEFGMLDTGYCVATGDNIGLSGPAIRNFENGMVSGQIYYCNDSSLNTVNSEVLDADGIRHADFITVLDDTANVDATGYAVYQCIRNYIAPSSVTKKSQFAAISGISTYFQEVATSAKAAFFTYLLAKNAYIKFLSGTQMVAQNSNGDVVGGMQGNPTLPIFWAGGSTPGTAPFRVDFLGALFATNATITGVINATSGIFKGFLQTHFVDMLDACEELNGWSLLGQNPNISYNRTFLVSGLKLPIPSSEHAGKIVNIIIESCVSKNDGLATIVCGDNSTDYYIKHPQALTGSDDWHRFRLLHGFSSYSGGYIQLICDGTYWNVTVNGLLDPKFIPAS